MSASAPAPQGDDGALFAEHHATLQERVRRRVYYTSQANVDEACSFAWLQLLRRQPRRETVLAWLTTVVVHEAMGLDRGARRLRPLEAAGDRPAAIGTLTRREARAALEVVASLPPRQREVLALHVAGYSYDEIAELTSRTYRAVDRHLRRAHAALRDR